LIGCWLTDTTVARVSYYVAPSANASIRPAVSFFLRETKPAPREAELLGFGRLSIAIARNAGFSGTGVPQLDWFSSFEKILSEAVV